VPAIALLHRMNKTFLVSPPGAPQPRSPGRCRDDAPGDGAASARGLARPAHGLRNLRRGRTVAEARAVAVRPNGDVRRRCAAVKATPMERVLTAGPELAMAEAAMAETPMFSRVHPLEPALPPQSAACPRAVRSRRRELLLPIGYHAAIAAVLAAAGHPPWRVGVVVLAGVLQQASFHACGRSNLRRCVNADADQLAVIVAQSQASFLVTIAATAAVTGGIRSPLVLTLLGPYLAAVSTIGDRRATRRLLAWTAAAAGLLALLPVAVTGPVIPNPAFGLLAVASALGVHALLAPVYERARRRRDEFARWRKEAAADALARAQSLEQIGSKVAHELKNPLTGVKALVQLGLRNPAEAASHSRLEVVEREVTRMQEILQNYLSFTRPLQAVAPRPVDLGSLVSDTLVVLAARADDAQVRLYSQGDATADVDPRRLKEALLNLVANAIEATPPGGEVAVDVRPAGDVTELVVRDTGHGMPAETLRRIGTPFFTTRDQGTGLGVVLARSVISQHGGALAYESDPGKGTRVRITLPRAATEGRDAARAAGG
jgi:signal transduction histidine kinase